MPDNNEARDQANPQNDMFSVIPIEVTVSVGRARPMIRDLLALGENSILSLDTRVDDPVELFVGGRLIARGELEELEGEDAGQLGVRLTEIIKQSGSFR
ncbi:FliM/FliN family flagellar motor switch protein [Aquicoccus porphyridii]|uniref:Flagellar motor switch protein FliN n=1 Tax=Aquicoccus porphyridii TaxID=1852029 RepID=A0A5A9ZGL3_9RHOB|nr:FliM/FliN family flagellar motor switch protein [Aquicoccus porphyridii]KAA0916139.1 hypothetical protein FLO80_10450 [Aquicoccus porphyridii]RAI52778.1 hypothetical protein DOO74_16660 [Rhodobacteraceae bacterium AsT-22]